MKLKCVCIYLIVSLVLTVLTLGAVSASYDADNLTNMGDITIFSDNVVQSVAQIEEIDSTTAEYEDITDEDSCGEILSTGRQNATYSIQCPEKVRMGNLWEDEYFNEDGIVKVCFENEDIDGKLEFYIDNKLQSTKHAKWFYDGGSEENYFALHDLKIQGGIHNVTIKYSGDDNYSPFIENRTFELYYMESNVPETVIDGSEYYNGFRIIFALDATGYLDLYIDDVYVFTFDVYDDRYLYYGEMSPWLLIEPSKYVSFGEHNYTAKYYGGNYDNKTVTGSFTLDYVFEAYNRHGDPFYGEPIIFYIKLPQGATNKITLFVNGKKYIILNDDGGEIEYVFDEQLYGKNDFIFVYGDEKFPNKNITCELDIKGKINMVYGDIPYLSNGENVTLILPDDANGNLSVYSKSWGDGEFLIATTNIVNGRASISLSNLTIGSYSIISKYIGEDYQVESEDSWINIIPNVKIPKGMWTESTDGYQITVQSPSDVDANLTIGVYTTTNDYDEDFEQELVNEIYFGDAKGTVSKTIPILEKGVYSIKVWYEVDGAIRFSENYELLVDDVNPNWAIEFDVPKEVVKYDANIYDYEFWPENLPINGVIMQYVLYIDGEYIETYYDGDPYLRFSLNELSLGNHTWKIDYSYSNYFNDLSVNGTFEVVWIAIPKEIIGNTTIECQMDNDVTGYVSLLIDGEEYAIEFLEDGYVSFILSNLTFGKHTYEFIYSGDVKHEKLTKTGSFNNTMYFEMDSWLEYRTTPIVRESYPVSFELPCDATGKITLTVGDKTYVQNVVNGTAYFNISDLNIKSYKLVAVYSGDDKYPTKEISKEFEITGYEIFIENDYNDEEYDSQKSTYASIVLPTDAIGNLVIYEEIYDDEYDIIYNEIKKVKLEKGKAKINISDLKFPFGEHVLKVAFEGDESYDIDYNMVYLGVHPLVNIPESVNVGEDAHVELNLSNATGSVVISINGVEFKTVEIKNGKVNVVIPADKLPNKLNVVNFRYVDDGVADYNPFNNYDWYYYGYQITVELNEISITGGFNGTANIMLNLSEKSKGNIIVCVDDKKVLTSPAKGGTNLIPVSDLSAGIRTITVKYRDVNGIVYSTSKDVLVKKAEPKIDVITTGNSNHDLSVLLPEDATGAVIINVGGKNYIADLVNGKTNISVPNLENWDHNVTIKYSGDNKYSIFTKNTRVTVNETIKDDAPELPAKDAVNETIKKDDAPELPAKADKIILKLTKVKVKKSAKKIVIKATLKVNGKKAKKNTKLTFKFNNKKYTAKTNTKGVAKVTINKNVLKKLKVGKNISYQVSYGKMVKKVSVKVKK